MSMQGPTQPAPVFQPLYYTRVSDLEARLGRDFMVAVYDDNNDGAPDASPLWRVLVDSQAYVEAFMRAGDYDIDLARKRGPALDTVVNLILDHAEATSYARHPEIARYDGDKALARVRINCLDIQKKVTRLDLDIPDGPPAGVGGATGRIGMGGERPSPVFADLGDFPGGRFG